MNFSFWLFVLPSVSKTFFVVRASLQAKNEIKKSNEKAKDHFQQTLWKATKLPDAVIDIVREYVEFECTGQVIIPCGTVKVVDFMEVCATGLLVAMARSTERNLHEFVFCPIEEYEFRKNQNEYEPFDEKNGAFLDRTKDIPELVQSSIGQEPELIDLNGMSIHGFKEVAEEATCSFCKNHITSSDSKEDSVSDFIAIDIKENPIQEHLLPKRENLRKKKLKVRRTNIVAYSNKRVSAGFVSLKEKKVKTNWLESDVHIHFAIQMANHVLIGVKLPMRTRVCAVFTLMFFFFCFGAMFGDLLDQTPWICGGVASLASIPFSYCIAPMCCRTVACRDTKYSIELEDEVIEPIAGFLLTDQAVADETDDATMMRKFKSLGDSIRWDTPYSLASNLGICVFLRSSTCDKNFLIARKQRLDDQKFTWTVRTYIRTATGRYLQS